MKNHFKQLVAAGQVALGAQLRLGTPAIAELFAAAGYDFLVLDGEHAPQTPVGLQAQMQAMNGYACTPIVRFGRNDPDEIRLALDIGAGGVLIPLIKTAAEAAQTVAACRYPPVGTRSYGPSRAHRYGFDRDYFPRSEPDVVVMVIIETAEAVEAIDEIVAVDGLDVVVMGTADLSIALGVPLQTTHPNVGAAIDKVIDAANRVGKPTAIGYEAGNPDRMRTQIRQGARVMLASGDEWILQAACATVVSGVAALR
jgi:2-dehydro-3-deoxyglucarate aldolase